VKSLQCIVLAMLASLTISAQDQSQGHAQDKTQAKQLKPVFLQAACDGKLSSVLLSSFKDAISSSQRYELVANLSDNGKMDAVLIIQTSCGESHNAVSVGSIYGMGKCFGPKNCHVSLAGQTLNVLMCDPNSEAICGREPFKEFEYLLATNSFMGVKLE
jgi:hypothetical protein